MAWRDRLQGFRDRLNETDSNEPDWVVVLSELYQADLPEEDLDTTTLHRKFTIDGLKNSTPINSESFYIAIEQLQSWGLINFLEERVQVEDDSGETEYQTISLVELTDDGFSVAHDRQLGRNQNRLNHSLVVFTFLLVFVNAIDMVPMKGEHKWIVGIVLVVGLGILMWKTDLLEW